MHAIFCKGKNPSKFTCENCDFFIQYKDGNCKCAIGSRDRSMNGFLLLRANNDSDFRLLEDFYSDHILTVNLSFHEYHLLLSLLRDKIDDISPENHLISLAYETLFNSLKENVII